MESELAPRVLVVEDEPKLASLVIDYLHAAHYQTHWIADGEKVLTWVNSHPHDLVLLDLMLPGKDGFELCREIRLGSQVPIIMMTARVEEIDRLLGLELGADDYVCKPFSPRELMARVKANLRRATWSENKPELGLVLDQERFSACIDNQALKLTPVEFRLLQCLGNSPGRVYSRDQLMQACYLDHRVVSDRTVDSHIKNLRRKIDEAAPGKLEICSVYALGYRLEPIGS